MLDHREAGPTALRMQIGARLRRMREDRGIGRAEAGAAIESFGEAVGSREPDRRVEELARLGGVTRLRELDIPKTDLQEVAELTAERPGARANPRHAGAAESGAAPSPDPVMPPDYALTRPDDSA